MKQHFHLPHQIQLHSESHVYTEWECCCDGQSFQQLALCIVPASKSDSFSAAQQVPKVSDLGYETNT